MKVPHSIFHVITIDLGTLTVVQTKVLHFQHASVVVCIFHTAIYILRSMLYIIRKYMPYVMPMFHS